MKSFLAAALFVAVSLVAAAPARAQEARSGEGTVVVTGTETFLTGNVGAGLKWYRGRWGLRGDYRFMAVQSKDDAPEFFGRETRYGHRFYGAVLLNIVR
jgi:hypothetical protein